MTLPEINYCQLIDRLTQSHFCFAIYRIPWTDEPILVLQNEAEAETLRGLEELNGKEGFVFAPFVADSKHPVVLIHSDYTATGWKDICNALSQFEASHSEEWTMEENANLPLEHNTDEAERKSKYTDAFNRFIAPLNEKTYSKLVLSRSATHALPQEFSPIRTFVKACNAYPRMMISLCHTPVTGTWIGSTPEIILSGQDTKWHTVALAGTMPIENEQIPTELSDKNREEQAYVSEYLRATIRQFGKNITEKGPYTARAGQLVHLKTDFHFKMQDTSHLGDVLKSLHPTPAVCGIPKADTYQFICNEEGYDRQYYSGIIGRLNPAADTQLYVNLRCMRIDKHTATLFAGSGILASSTAESEWEETCEKMKTMQTIL